MKLLYLQIRNGEIVAKLHTRFSLKNLGWFRLLFCFQGVVLHPLVANIFKYSQGKKSCILWKRTHKVLAAEHKPLLCRPPGASTQGPVKDHFLTFAHFRWSHTLLQLNKPTCSLDRTEVQSAHVCNSSFWSSPMSYFIPLFYSISYPWPVCWLVSCIHLARLLFNQTLIQVFLWRCFVDVTPTTSSL